MLAGGLAALAAAVAAVLLAAGYGVRPLVPLLALGGLAFLAERRSIRLNSVTEVTVSFLPIVFGAVVLGPLAAMAIAAIGVLSQFGEPHVRWVVWTASRMLAGAAAGVAVTAGGLLWPEGFGMLLIGAVAACVAHVLVDFAAGYATAKVRQTASLRSMLTTHGPFMIAVVPLYAPVVAGLAYVYFHLSPWSVALFLIPAYVAQRLNVLYREQRESAIRLSAANQRLEKANTSFASALVATLEARDRYTAGHSAAVAVYAREIAKLMGLPADEQRRAHLAGLVHDIGKIGLPPGLVEKAGPLEFSERREMETHCVIGERILANIEDYNEIAKIVRHHHERFDGTGYPDRFSANQIPLISRILAVADAYDAMTSDRPYRDAMPAGVARLRLSQAAGAQFDPAVVAAFEAVLDAAGTDPRGAGAQETRQGVGQTAAVALLAS